MTTEDLLAELRSSPTDLARVVEAVASRELPYVLVSIATLKGWQERDPDAWRKVEAWLIARRKTVVEVRAPVLDDGLTAAHAPTPRPKCGRARDEDVRDDLEKNVLATLLSALIAADPRPPHARAARAAQGRRRA